MIDSRLGRGYKPSRPLHLGAGVAVALMIAVIVACAPDSGSDPPDWTIQRKYQQEVRDSLGRGGYIPSVEVSFAGGTRRVGIPPQCFSAVEVGDVLPLQMLIAGGLVQCRPSS